MKISIIGGAGKMGRWFTRFLSREGMTVSITGRNQEKLLEAKQQLGVEITTNIEGAKEADVILLSVPINNFETVVQEISPYITANQIIVDITSVKVLPVTVMHKYIKKGITLGTHPVFGPGARSIAKKSFVLTPTNQEEEALAQKAQAFLERAGAIVSLLTPQEHDEIMTVVLGLSHFIAITCADSILSNEKYNHLEAIGGSTYKALLALAKSVASEDPELYASIQMSLPNMVETETLFLERLRSWADLVRNKDQEGFARRMRHLRTKFEEVDPNFNEAYKKLSSFTESL